MSENTEIENVDDWIKSLYEKDNEYVVEYMGKKLTFKKRFSTELLFKLNGKPQDEQAYSLIAILSKKPILTIEQARKLPQDLLTKIMLGLDLDPDIIKKKLALKPS